MTLDDLDDLRFKTHAFFEPHHENLLSAATMYRNDCSFWQYKVYADILGVSLERGRQTTAG